MKISVCVGEAGLRKLRLKALSVASARKRMSRDTPMPMTRMRCRDAAVPDGGSLTRHLRDASKIGAT